MYDLFLLESVFRCDVRTVYRAFFYISIKSCCENVCQYKRGDFYSKNVVAL